MKNENHISNQNIPTNSFNTNSFNTNSFNANSFYSDSFYSDSLNTNLFSNNLTVKLITKKSPYFPKKLYDLPDCPEILFVLGNEKILDDFSISIVGTRNSSTTGNDIALDLSNNLSNNNIIIVSGLASGIDTQAHLGALSSSNPKTIAIIACGFNHLLTNSKNIKLIKKILDNNGAIITEYFPDTPPQKFSFLKRNRLIAAISETTIVIEAPLKSGALNTATTALSLGKKVFAIPWAINTFRGEGCNNLIQNGAHLLTNHTQILTYFNLANSCNSFKDSSQTSSKNSCKQIIPKEFLNLYKCIIKNEPITKENIYTYFPNEKIADINSKLLLMELENLISLNRKYIFDKKDLIQILNLQNLSTFKINL